MAEMTEKRRILLLFSVLAGLFLMHGLTAVGPGGCHGAPPSTMPMRMPASTAPMRTQMAAPPAPEASATSLSPDSMADHAMAGESCVPLRPKGLSGLLPALFLIVTALWRPWLLPRIARSIRCHWPHGPPRTGVQILRTLSISRT